MIPLEETKKQEIELGIGVLNWPRSERVSDRYGTVHLLDEAGPAAEQLLLKELPEGQTGSLIAEVLESRKSTHIGDLFRGIFPSTPEVGAKIILGHGKLFYNGNHVGLQPEDDREKDWLDPHALYQVHEQTVKLIFVPEPK